MVSGKIKFALWLTPEAKRLVDEGYRSDNCASRSEFIEKAVRFYCGYLAAEEAGAYLPRVLASSLEGMLNLFGDRISHLLFKQAVELAMLTHIIAADTDVDEEALERLRGRCVRNVGETRGSISFRDILRFQKSV